MTAVEDPRPPEPPPPEKPDPRPPRDAAWWDRALSRWTGRDTV